MGGVGSAVFDKIIPNTLQDLSSLILQEKLPLVKDLTTSSKGSDKCFSNMGFIEKGTMTSWFSFLFARNEIYSVVSSRVGGWHS
ncbi:hypothetical protein R50345_00245 [Paenibacillus sp. FSL R5-0345]|nr:hypothetical protein R50345_00245 [Paenibacillus sp. FSL R5-0345]